MGFRSMLITEDAPVIEIPDWFLQKYENVGFSEHHGKVTFPVRTKHEQKFYASFNETDIFLDIQKLIIEKDVKDIVCILLHECDGITKVVITQTEIYGMEPTDWKKVTVVEHDYCYRCSDIKNIKD